MNGVVDQYFTKYLSLTTSLHASKLEIPIFNKYYKLLFQIRYYILKHSKILFCFGKRNLKYLHLHYILTEKRKLLKKKITIIRNGSRIYYFLASKDYVKKYI